MNNKILISFLLVLLTVMVSGCESSAPSVSYWISISGLNNFTVNDESVIMIPAIMMYGEPLFDNDDIRAYYPNDSGWKPVIVSTERGYMISFRLNNSSPNNIKLEPVKRFSPIELPSINERRSMLRDDILESPFYPIFNETTPYTQWRYNNTKNYSSYIYINGLASKNMSNTISLLLVLEAFEGQVQSQYGSTYRIYISEVIPGNVSGWIPVKVQYGYKEAPGMI